MRYAVRAVQTIALVGGLCTVAYGVYVAVAYLRFGHPAPAAQRDAVLDRFMPVYDVREERSIRVNAPAATTMDAARNVSLNDSPVVQAIFRGREIVLRSRVQRAAQPRAFVDLVQSIGWRLLIREPGRELVFGAVTQPWKANVVFRGIEPSKFAQFSEPDYVKIVWTLRADPLGKAASRFSTETRAVTTSADAREQFRRYWAAYSPGIILIRQGALPLIRDNAERRAHSRIP